MTTRETTTDRRGPRRSLSDSALAAAVAAAIVAAGALLGVVVLLFSAVANDDSRGATASASPAAEWGAGPSGAPAPGARPGRVVVRFDDSWLQPGGASVPAGRTTFVVRNESGAYHDLMIERMPIEFAGPNRPVEMAAEAGVEDLVPGATGKMVVNLRPGRYELFCSVPAHYASGLHTELTVTRASSGAPS